MLIIFDPSPQSWVNVTSNTVRNVSSLWICRLRDCHHADHAQQTNLHNATAAVLLANSDCRTSGWNCGQKSRFSTQLANSLHPNFGWNDRPNSSLVNQLANQGLPSSDWRYHQSSSFRDLLAISRNLSSGMLWSRFRMIPARRQGFQTCRHTASKLGFKLPKLKLWRPVGKVKLSKLGG